MCGVPVPQRGDLYRPLVAKGYKVAICEQMEDPALAKGLVKRDIVRVITPGTVLESSMLDETRNNFICSLCAEGKQAGICFADISTGELHATTLEGEDLEERLVNELSRYSPREILINPDALEYKTLPPFIKERLSASLELLEAAEYEAETCETACFGAISKGDARGVGPGAKPAGGAGQLAPCCAI